MDKIQYSLPFGLIGSIFHPILVKNKLDHIFRYRNLKIKEIFGEIKWKPFQFFGLEEILG